MIKLSKTRIAGEFLFVGLGTAFVAQSALSNADLMWPSVGILFACRYICDYTLLVWRLAPEAAREIQARASKREYRASLPCVRIISAE